MFPSCSNVAHGRSRLRTKGRSEWEYHTIQKILYFLLIHKIFSCHIFISYYFMWDCICSFPEQQTGSQQLDALHPGREAWTRGAPSPERASPLHNAAKVKFEAPKVPVIFVLGKASLQNSDNFVLQSSVLWRRFYSSGLFIFLLISLVHVWGK